MKTRIWILVLVVVAGGLAGIRWSATLTQRATLADGTELTLAAVTFGKEHHYVSGGVTGRLQAWVAKSLRPLGLNLRMPPEANQTTGDAVMFWFTVRSPKPGNTSVPGFCVVDDSGVGSIRPAVFPLSLSPTDRVAAVGFETFPRRLRQVRVQVYDYDAATGGAGPLAAQFQAANRRFRRLAAWTASPMPVRVSDRELVFSLDRLVTGVSFTSLTNRAAEPWDAATLAEFRITENGAIRTNWQPVRIEASDAAGDTPRFHGSRLQPGPEGVGVIFRDALWTQEPAWKLRVEFSRTAGFDPGESWTTSIPDLGAALGAGRGSARSLSERTLESGSTVSVVGLSPGGQPGVSYLLCIRVAPAPRERRLSLVAVTDAGTPNARSVESDLFSSTFANSAAEYYYNLRGVSNAGALQLTLALHRSRFIEFTARAEALK